jgi:zinc D-Ala-D-Ala carboxypeptidase
MKAQWDLYPNFSKSEFDCKETGDNEMKHSFMSKMQALRTAYGKPIDISSGFRSYEHSAERKKPSKNGAHPLGLAADIRIAREEAYVLLKLALELGFTGIGISQQGGGGRFLHLDTIESNEAQPRPTIWSY